ncbi:MAG: hypothetical protein ACRDC4_16535, partial [Plesiomonas sp.]
MEIANASDLPDCALIDFFCYGLNPILKDILIHEAPRSSFSDFLDYALLISGSPFTVGVADEEASLKQVLGRGYERRAPMATELGQHFLSVPTLMLTTPELTALANAVTSELSLTHTVMSEPPAASTVTSELPIGRAVMSELSVVSTITSESSLIPIVNSKPPVKDKTFQSSAVTDTIPVFPGVVDEAIDDAKVSYSCWGLIAKLTDPSLRTVRKAGFPKPQSSCILADVSLVSEFIWPSSVFPIMAVALLCVWSTFTETALNTAAHNSEPVIVYRSVPEPGSVSVPEPESVPEPILVCRSVPEEESVPKPESVPVPESILVYRSIPEPKSVPEPESVPELYSMPEPVLVYSSVSASEPESVPEPESELEPESEPALIYMSVPEPKSVPELEFIPEPVLVCRSVSESLPVNESGYFVPMPIYELDAKPTPPKVSSDLVFTFEYCLVSMLVNSATPVTNVDVKSVCRISFVRFAADPPWRPSAQRAPPWRPSAQRAPPWRPSAQRAPPWRSSA